MPYVNFAKNSGVIGGYSDGSFGPGRNITRAEVAKILMLLIGLQN
jgi:hypothetical protein